MKSMFAILKQSVILILTILVFSTSSFAQTPIIDRAIFFDNPEITYGKLSPDATKISFLKAHNGILNIWVKDFNATFDDAQLLTTNSSPIRNYHWTHDSKYIIYLKDDNGDENYNIYAVDPNAIISEDEVAPPSRNLSPMEDVRVEIELLSKKNPDQIIIGINDRDKAWHDLYQLTISTGALDKILENDNRYNYYYFDWDEKLRMFDRTLEQGNDQIIQLNEDGTTEEMYSADIDELFYITDWTKDNSLAYLISNKGDADLQTLYTLNPNTKEVVKVESDPENKVDINDLVMNEHTREIIATAYYYDKKKYYFKDKEWEKNYQYLQRQFPERAVDFLRFSSDYSKMLIKVYGDKYATEVYYFNLVNKELIHQYTLRPKLKMVEEHLSTMQPIRYKSSDGLEIPGYLSLPANAEAKNLPTIVIPHGGPKGARDKWGYNGMVQFLTNRGYAVLQPNFRAGGGYGKAFMNAGKMQMGKLMQDDITWGVQHLINEGIADANRVAIMGTSYGGYATLVGLAFTPDLYACGIDIVGPSNMLTLAESIPPYWTDVQQLYDFYGNPNTEEGRKFMREISPLFYADKMKKPLLVVQGGKDVRVAKSESEQIVIALRDKGHPIEYLLAEDEGHGFVKPLNKMAMYAKIEQFLAEHIGTPYQKDMPDDVRETLDKLTIDVHTVKLKEKIEIDALTEMPVINYEWKEGKSVYDVMVEMQGQEIPMEMERTISKDDDNWKITEKIEGGPMGISIEESVYDVHFNSLTKMIDRGEQKVQFKYNNGNATIEMMGKEIAVKSDKGIIIGDGAGYDIFLSALSLKEGDQLSYYVADIMTTKPKQFIVEHHGNNSINGTACELISVIGIDDENDSKIFWLDPSTKEAIKMEMLMPSLGGAKVTMVKK